MTIESTDHREEFSIKILFVSPEVVPFAKTGGLADVAGSLPKAIKALGHDIRIAMPKYKMIDEKKFGLRKIVDGVDVPVAGRVEKADIFTTVIPKTDITTYFISGDKYFLRDELYQVKGIDYEDNCERFTFFCRGVLEFLKGSNFKPDIVHCNDWQSALVIPYIKKVYSEDPYFKETATVYSIHNMGYQGVFPAEQILITGFGWDMYTYDKLEFYGKIALTKAGFVFADVINTVSETYAKEIQTPEYGHGLDGLLYTRSKDVYGIINGIDYDLWNPEEDPYIVRNYSAARLELKLDNKLALQEKNTLPKNKDIPLISLISRLADQKGLDILAGAIEDIMHLRCQLVILGTGEPKYHELLLSEKKKYPDHIGVNLGFDAALAQLIYAGSDMFLMPSRYEPCGLGQLISFKYGTIPIVRKTGGLADTVREFKGENGEGDGFVFEEYSSKALLSAVKRAIEAYKNKKIWQSLQAKVMGYDYSWDASAKKYIALYKKAKEKLGPAF